MSSEWHKLYSQSETIPPLLFQYTSTREGYELHLTDLTSIWSERLRHQDILDRAEQSSTTIDPSEGDNQLDLLLTKIGEALSGADGKPSLNSGSEVDSIEINISAKLPAPLRPLKWKLQLSKEPASSLTSRIILPLLKEEVMWESRQKALLSQLQHKDWVLDRLFGHIQSLDLDLASIFPSAAGISSARKGDIRSRLSKVVKGVATFDEQAWFAQSSDSSDKFNLASNIVHEMDGSDSRGTLMHLKPTQDHWWNGLDKFSETTSQEEAPREAEQASKEQASINHPKNKQAKISQEDTHDDAGAETTDSEFERYEGPPRGRKLAKNNKTPSQPSKANTNASPEPKKNIPTQAQVKGSNESTASETESESDLDSAPAPQKAKTPSISPEQAPAVKPPKKALGRLGVIGGKKKESKELRPSPTPSPPPPQASASKHSSPINDTEPAPDSKQAPSPAKVKKASKLGVIGGKNNPKRQETPLFKPSTLPPTHQSPTRSPMRKQESPEQMVKDPPKEEKSAEVPVQAPPQVPETEKEKAARRREELKRQLEVQSKAPAKKKRRF